MVNLKKLYSNIFCVAMILFSQFCLANNSYIQEITSENFKQNVEQSELPVFIKFFATWCMNCKRLDLQMTEVLGDFKDSCVFATIDIDKNQDFLQNLLQGIFEKHFHIVSGFPCVLLFHKGVFKGSFLGFFAGKEDLSKKIHEMLIDIGC